MSRFENGVQWYTRGKVEISFPEDVVICRYCPMMRADAGNTRHVCIITGEILGNIDFCPRTCPIEDLKEDERDDSLRDG